MPFIPHTPQDVKDMLEVIGVKSTDTLFDEIPASLQKLALDAIPNGMNEIEITRLMQQRAQMDANNSCYIGAGAYEHHIPAAVWDITSRGEFMTAYTPYQAEASQGTLQLLYEYQTMIASLTGMEVSNASMYDGASALAEAMLMAIRCQPKQQRTILMPQALHPHYRQTAQGLVSAQGIQLVEIPYDQHTGTTTQLDGFAATQAAALVIAQPNFFGQLEDVDALTDWAHANNMLVIAVVNPTALALLKEPGSWGARGADIVCGEGQPLGIPLASGGPYFGFLTTRMQFVRQMPGRIVGRTVDKEGKPGFTLTLQAREQHIRRAKATSNICTNQGLAVTAATIYMSLLGDVGLAKTAFVSHQNTLRLADLLSALPQVKLHFTGAFFHEMVLELPILASRCIEEMAHSNIAAGYDLGIAYPELDHCLLICVTETKIEADLQYYVRSLQQVLRHHTNGNVAKNTAATCE